MTSRFTPDQVLDQLERMQMLALQLDTDMRKGEPTNRAICRYLDLILATNIVIVNALLIGKGDPDDV